MRRLLGTLLTAACAAILVAPPASAGHGGHSHGGLEVRQQVLDPAAGFRGLDARDRDTAWVTGARVVGETTTGLVFRTHDGGRSWDDVSPPGSAGLQFRDVEVLGPRTAVVLAIGVGEASRVYRTTDDGRTWTETARGGPSSFFDCLDFYPDGRTGLVMGDPVDGKFQILRTRDGGASWTTLPSDGMPAAGPAEAGFAASGDCLVIDRGTASFGTGGDRSRIFSSTDRGLTWRATDSTIPAGEAAGVFGLAFDGGRGVAVGGDFAEPADGTDASAVRAGSRWRSGGDLTHLAEDAAFLPHGLLLATGESGEVAGSSWSRDGGRSWERLTGTGFHTLDCVRTTCFAAGGKGRVAVVELRR